MRFKMVFKLENNIIDIQYKKAIVSWIKSSLEKYDKELFLNLYDKNQTKAKSFTFSPVLRKPRFLEDSIILEDNFIDVFFSVYDYGQAIGMFNSFLNQQFKKFSLNKNSMTLIKIVMITEKQIKSNEVLIRTMSPVICRNHDLDTLKDMYYSFEREEFDKFIRINIANRLKENELDLSLLDDFQITPVHAKKIVVKSYEKMIECSIGIFKLKGDTKLLDYLYKSGLGVKTAMGFGMIDIIK